MKKLIMVISVMLAQLLFVSTVSAQPTNSNQLSDPRVRQALCMAIDMELIKSTLFEDQISTVNLKKAELIFNINN